MNLIEVKSIYKRYGKGDTEQEVLKDISFTIEEGEMVSIMGPSGSGKSILLHILGLLDKQSEGTYILDKVDVAKLTDEERAYTRNEKIGFVFQSFNLIKEISALDNVQMALKLSNLHRKANNKLKKSEIKSRSIEVLKSLGLEKHMYKKPTQLSGGQQQRVAIARALVNNSMVILADEPTGALDQQNSREIMNILKGLQEQGKTIVIITHDEKVAEYCERKLNMLDGEIHT